MQMRRRLLQGGLITETRPTDADGWTIAATNPLGFESPFRPAWEAEHARDSGVPDGREALPFQPSVVRSYSISEKHAEQAARGYMEGFVPAAVPAAKLWKRAFNRSLPGMSPGKLSRQQPTYFMANVMTYVPSGVDVPYPSFPTKALDWELQIGFLIGRPLRNATPAEGTAAVVAAVLLCDFSARDVQMREMGTRLGPQKGKHFLGSMAAVARSADEVLDHWTDLTGTISINDQVVARPTTRGATWQVGDLVAQASKGESVTAGEMVGSGSLTDGAGMEQNRYLAIGDRIRLELPLFGAIEHRVVAAR